MKIYPKNENKQDIGKLKVLKDSQKLKIWQFIKILKILKVNLKVEEELFLCLLLVHLAAPARYSINSGPQKVKSEK